MNLFLAFAAVINLSLYSSFSFSQEKYSAEQSTWNYNFELDFYFQDPFFILPIFQADNKKLHLEARYNYEELNTFSGWGGYNFSGGKNFQYLIIPMGGFLAGRITGLAPGLELTFNFLKLELYSASEYVFDLKDRENNFYYNWTDLTFAPVDWFYFGLSAQRTKAYQTDIDIQHGILAGGSYKNLETSVYYYNPGGDDEFLFLTIAAGF